MVPQVLISVWFNLTTAVASERRNMKFVWSVRTQCPAGSQKTSAYFTTEVIFGLITPDANQHQQPSTEPSEPKKGCRLKPDAQNGTLQYGC